MGNDQLCRRITAVGEIADEYIAVVDGQPLPQRYGLFRPLMEKFKSIYGFYPKYPVADAATVPTSIAFSVRRSSMEKYMKFTMYRSQGRKVSRQSFRGSISEIDDKGNLRCPNNMKMVFSHRKGKKTIMGGGRNLLKEQRLCHVPSICKKSDKNRPISLNQAALQEVRTSDVSTAHVRTNRSYKPEGTFGVIKYDRWYKTNGAKGQQRVKRRFIWFLSGLTSISSITSKSDSKGCYLSSKSFGAEA